jgi:aminoglycoside phosphotransferase (APT) family kinase protein
MLGSRPASAGQRELTKRVEVSPGSVPGGQQLRDWVERLLDGTVVEWRRLVSGNSRATWSVDVETGSGRVALVVRVDSGDGPYSDTPFTLGREASIYTAMQDRGVAVPKTYGFDDGLSAMVLERVGGQPAWDESVFGAALEELTRLHAIDVGTLSGDWLAQSSASDLEQWAEIAARRIGRPSPLIDYAVQFLRERFPGEPERLVMVHGDTGPGNVLWDGRRITALLDWELSHIGDPHDDLAFLTVRAAMHGIELPDFSAHARARYFAHTGVAPDDERLRYWQAVGILRNVITFQASISNPVRGRDRLVHHLLAPSLNRMLVDALARIEGIELPPPALMKPVEPLPGMEVIREIADELTEVVGSLTDDEVRQRARRMRYLLTQLADTFSLAPAVAAAEQREPQIRSDATGATLERLARATDRSLSLFPRALPMTAVSLPRLS